MSAVARTQSPTEGALQRLSSQGFVQYHPVLADKLGSFKAALFLGHALYWARHVQTNYRSRDGWFFLSARQCTEATGLSAREQASARQLLIEHSLLAEMLAGKPAKLHYKVDLTQLAHFLGMYVVGEAPTWQQLLPLFQGCINFYRPLAVIAGNVASGLYLSYLLAQHRSFLAYERRGAGFTVSQSALRAALCLGVKTQRNARDRLKQIGLLVENGNLVQINLQALCALLQGQGNKPLKQRPVTRSDADVPNLELVASGVDQPTQAEGIEANSSRLFNPGTTAQKQLFDARSATRLQQPQPTGNLDTAHAQIVAALRSTGTKAGRLFGGRLAGKRQPAGAPSLEEACQTVAQNAKLELPVAQNANLVAQTAKLTCPKRETNLPKAQNIKVFNNNNTTTSTAPAPVDNFEPGASAEQACRRSSFDTTHTLNSLKPAAPEVETVLMPAALGADWHAAVRRVLAKARPELRQSLIDELEGQLSIKAISNPAGYLHSLRVAVESGVAVLAHAEAVAAQRRQRERTADALEQHAKQQVELTAAATPSMSAAEARARLRQLSREMGGAR